MKSVIPVADRRWGQLLAGAPHDVFHTAGFHRFAATVDDGEPYLAVVGDADRGLAWPYVLRELRQVEGLPDTGAKDVGSLHGYTGPVSWGVTPDDPWLDEAWAYIRETWLSQGAVTAFVRFHPLLSGAGLAPRLGLLAADTVRAEGATVSIDCTSDDDEALGAYARVTRQEVDRARRSGLVTEPDEDWRHIGDFVRLHEATLRRNGACPEDGLALHQILHLRDALAGDLHLLVTRAGEDVVAAGLFTEYGGIIQALLVGTDDDYRRLSPLKLHLDDVRRWGHERGDRVLHLGGGRGGREDSLFAFKGRFSSRRHRFFTGRWILDPVAYDELVALRQRRLAQVGRSASSDGWFPRYRAPLEPSGRVITPVDGGARRPRLVPVSVHVDAGLVGAERAT